MGRTSHPDGTNPDDWRANRPRLKNPIGLRYPSTAKASGCLFTITWIRERDWRKSRVGLACPQYAIAGRQAILAACATNALIRFDWLVGHIIKNAAGSAAEVAISTRLHPWRTLIRLVPAIDHTIFARCA